MLRSFIKTLIVPTRNYAIKSDLKIKWIGPEIIPFYDSRKSGDLAVSPKVDQDEIGLDFKNIKQLEGADPEFRKFFTVKYLGPKEGAKLARKELWDKVKRHKYDNMSMESTIALYTARIRNLQDEMIAYPRNGKLKDYLNRMITKRKKFMGILRRRDYKLYEWLLEKIDLEYKAHPEKYHWITRKESLRKLTDVHCDNLRATKLNDYKKLLESQQGPFLEKKLAAYKMIRSEQESLELPVTITTQDIKAVEKLLAEWQIKNIPQEKVRR